MLKIFIWGTGEIAEATLKKCRMLNTYQILGFIDNNKEKVGGVFHGEEIYNPSILNTEKPDAIVALTDAYEDIKRQVCEQYPDLSNIVENKYYFYKQSILKRYKCTTDREIKELLKFIKGNGLDIFNYPFADKYKNMEIEVYCDNTNGLFYVIHDGKRLYFSRKYKTEEAVLHYYRSILMEQDEDSPHKYFSSDYRIESGDIVVDLGVAEGNFSLEIIEKAAKVYLIEADEDWIEALQYTFKDYMDKVRIIKSFVSSYNEGDFSTLDELIKEPVNFIKMDIEGNEWDALTGAIDLISKSDKLKMTICSYHRDYDQELIESFMKKYNFEYEYSKGYMWFYEATKFRRALVRGTKLQRDIVN